MIARARDAVAKNERLGVGAVPPGFVGYAEGRGFARLFPVEFVDLSGKPARPDGSICSPVAGGRYVPQ